MFASNGKNPFFLVKTDTNLITVVLSLNVSFVGLHSLPLPLRKENLGENGPCYWLIGASFSNLPNSEFNKYVGK